MSEKRRYMRFNVLMDAITNRNGVLKRFKVNNFSREGVGIISTEPLLEGEDLEIEMTIPGDNIPVVLGGQIAWASGPISDDAQHRSGMKFREIDNHDRSRILEYVYQKWITPAKSGLS